MDEFQHTAARRRLVPTAAPRYPHHRFNTQPPEGGWLFFGAEYATGTMFQHTAARRRLGRLRHYICRGRLQFQHTAARRRLALPLTARFTKTRFQHTAARRRLGGFFVNWYYKIKVSTHSRPKAAGKAQIEDKENIISFNTQPPEGGWPAAIWRIPANKMFQHTAARRRLDLVLLIFNSFF